MLVGLVGLGLLTASVILMWHPGPRRELAAPSDQDPAGSGDVAAADTPRVDDGTVSPPPVPSPDPDALSRLRRTFRPEVRILGEPGPENRALLLDGLTIHPSSLPRFTPAASGRATAVYWVQVQGPVRPAWRDRAVALGAEWLGYLPHHTILLRMSTSTAKRLAGEAWTTWIHPVLAEAKIQPFLSFLRDLPPGERPATVAVSVTTYRPDETSTIAAFAAGEGIAIRAEESGRRWGWLTLDLPLDRLDALASLDGVQWVEEWVPPRMVNNVAVKDGLLGLTNLWAVHGLTGEGQIIGHADTGLDTGSLTNLHPDLAERLLAVFDLGRSGNWSDPDGHGTHTAGSLVGNGAMSTGTIRGAAWGAQLVHQSVMDSGGGLGGLPSDLNDLYGQTYDLGARIHSDSWGSDVYGLYTTAARQSDEFMWDHPEMLLVFAAGNSGADWNSDGVVDLDSIGSPATAKNVLTVGASENDRPPGSGGASDIFYGLWWPWDYPAEPIRFDMISSPREGGQGLAAFSSRGPTDDGRIKPDLVAPGTDILSLRSRASGAGTGWGAYGNPGYTFNGGTSMSTPLIAGSAALVRQYFKEEGFHDRPSAALVKATLIHASRSLSPGQYGTNTTREIPAASPNVVEGWGQPDLGSALYPGDGTTWFFRDEPTGLAAPGETADLVFFAETGAAVRVTLAWTDYPASAGAARTLVNDLDLTVRGPAGEVYGAGPDRSNNVERVTFTPAASGIHTVQVAAFTVPQGPQPWAAVVHGRVTAAPILDHDPLGNTLVTNSPYTVTARVSGASGSVSNRVTLHWKRGDATNAFAEITMTPAGVQTYTGAIPAQPRDTEILYYVRAERAGLVATSPEAAPTGTHRFRVTGPVTLTVSGSPGPVFSVEPAYGVHVMASGSVVRFAAPAYSNLLPGTRLAMREWTGSGSLAAHGTATVFTATLETDSDLTWFWQHQYELIQTSSVPGLAYTSSWWYAWDSASTFEAPAEPEYDGTVYAFAGWWVDGVRQPNATSRASRVASGILMYGPRIAGAHYLEYDRDDDADGVADWWEWFYFGGLDQPGHTDGDFDGFTNLKEFQDRTDPTDAASQPQPPSIAHFPLTDPRTNPAPWTLSAEVADNHGLASVSLRWTRNHGVTNLMKLSPGLSGRYDGFLPAPGTNGDVFVYRMEAVDLAGLRAVSGPYTVQARYPRMEVLSGPPGFVGLEDGASTSVTIAVTNAGLGELAWQAEAYAWYDDIEQGENGVTHGGLEDVWHRRGSRFVSWSSAWHFGEGPEGQYPDAADAWLLLPPLEVPPEAVLRFDHWARMEYDTDQMDDHYWDGGVLEISTNGGASFFMVEPVGGYPHRITDNPASPFEPDTPCYGETDGWETGTVDLRPYAGRTIRFRFRFGSDFYVREEGWYIDNVRVEVEDPGWWAWLDPLPRGTLAAGGITNGRVAMSTDGLEPGETRSAVLVAGGNDPETPRLWLLPVELHNLSRRLAVTSEGAGTVQPSGDVLVRAGTDTSFWISADAYFEIASILTNGLPAAQAITGRAMGFVWANVATGGTLHVRFAEAMAAGRVPEAWLAARGYTNQPFDLEASTDHDGDGMLTWQEYVAETEPGDPASVALVVDEAWPEGTNGVVAWLSYTNLDFTYTVEQAAGVNVGFAAVATNLPATPPVNVYTSPAGDFILYRVIRE